MVVRATIPAQMRYSGVFFASPCRAVLFPASEATFSFQHPHDFVCPNTMALLRVTNIVPQKQRALTFRGLFFSAGSVSRISSISHYSTSLPAADHLL